MFEEENKTPTLDEQEVTENMESVIKDEPKINVADVKDKMWEVRDKIKEKFEEPTTNQEKIKPIITSRVLFISALDKIFIIILLLMLVSMTWNNFIGDLSSPGYGFWYRVAGEIGIIFIIIIEYLFLNWLYKCAAKTMLCLTQNEVYTEKYVPFKRSETSIPLGKITGVTTYNVFWIFRTIIIHQYGKLPLIFFTWTNQEFKDKLTELITTDNKKVENEFENKNIISKEHKKFLKFLGIGLIAIITLIGVARAINYMTSPARQIPGTYTDGYDTIIIENDGTCNIDDFEDDVTECNWYYTDETSSIEIRYEYEYYSYYYGTSTRTDYMYMTYNKDNKTILYDGDIYTK